MTKSAKSSALAIMIGAAVGLSGSAGAGTWDGPLATASGEVVIGADQHLKISIEQPKATLQSGGAHRYVKITKINLDDDLADGGQKVANGYHFRLARGAATGTDGAALPLNVAATPGHTAKNIDGGVYLDRTPTAMGGHGEVEIQGDPAGARPGVYRYTVEAELSTN